MHKRRNSLYLSGIKTVVKKPGSSRVCIKSVVAGYYHRLVKFKFHVVSSRSLRPRTGRIKSMVKVYRCHNFQQSVKPHTTKVVAVKCLRIVDAMVRKSDAGQQNILILVSSLSF